MCGARDTVRDSRGRCADKVACDKRARSLAARARTQGTRAPRSYSVVATGKRVPAVGDKLMATTPDECFETGKVYTVVAVYDGKMDLECAALDTTVAGVQIDDPSLQPYTGER